MEENPIQKFAVDKIPEADKSVERINAYLDSKLSLFSNINFNSIPTLKPILISYMSLYGQSEDRIKLKHDTKNQLISAGVFNDEEGLEFLLLVAEKERSFEDCPNSILDEDLGKYYFEKYKSNEKWSQRHFEFHHINTNSYQEERSRILEEVALIMIAHSRASLEKAINSIPEEITELIEKVDAYFQKAFSSIFGTNPPLFLTEVTHVTKEFITHADRISGNTFININNFFRDENKFIHLVIHEAMHLCSSEFKGEDNFVEEGLIEFYIEKMFKEYPSHDFSYTPTSETYQDYKNDLKFLFQLLPDAEKHFTTFFLTQDIRPLSIFLKNNFSDEIRKIIKNKFYHDQIPNFIDSIQKIPTNSEISSVVEFPPLKKEDLEEIRNLFLSLYVKFFDKEVLGFEEYTGIDKAVGAGGICYNSMVTLWQLEYAIALTRHPIIKNMVKEIYENKFDMSKFDAKALVENKIMTGIKILDLGCGSRPVFARCCSAMGADVWTVDKDPIQYLPSQEKSFTLKQKDLEIGKHIQLNLNNSEAVKIITERSLGDFNLVTQANLIADGFDSSKIKAIALSLLKKGGVYQDSVYDPKGILKE